MMAMMLDQGEPSDASLARRAAAGERDAFAELVVRHYDFIYRVAYRWCGRRQDAEDVAQDVCARLAHSIRSFRGEGALTTWLYALTLNVARDAGRRRQRDERKAQAFGVHALISGEEPEEPDDRAERMWAAVRTLPDKQREAMLLVYGEGLSHASASDVMNCAEATVSWHVHEAKKRLTRLLRAAGDER
jgi:RNA polymerase sigma factor, sigma-70 family